MSEPAPEPADTSALEAQAKAAIDSYRDFLASPAFQHSIDLAVLVKIAGDENADIRERRRAAEVLAKLRLQAMEGLAELVAAREQALDKLGLKAGPQTLALTQVNQQIEIVRAKDWRGAAPLEEGEDVVVEALPAQGAPETNGHAKQEANAEDPAS